MMMSIDLPATTWFLSLLQLLIACAAGVLLRWLSEKFLWPTKVWPNRFVMLFFFGLVILFVHVH
jgi:hypothetical protein